MMKRSLSIPEWHWMALRDEAPPVRIMLHGGSMFPLIRMDRDYVTIESLKERPKPGEIVLFPDLACKERYVVHRVRKVEGDNVLTWGDNCSNPDPWMPLDAIWGRVVLIERGEKQIRPDRKKGLRHARAWNFVRKPYQFCRRIVGGIKRRIWTGTRHEQLPINKKPFIQ